MQYRRQNLKTVTLKLHTEKFSVFIISMLKELHAHLSMQSRQTCMVFPSYLGLSAIDGASVPFVTPFLSLLPPSRPPSILPPSPVPPSILPQSLLSPPPNTTQAPLNSPLPPKFTLTAAISSRSMGYVFLCTQHT